MKLGDLIKEYRIEKGLSQRQFAIKCNLSNGFISMVESNYNPKTKRPITLTLNSMKKIANGMNLTVDDLVERTDDIPVMLSDLFDKHDQKWMDDLFSDEYEKLDIFSNDELFQKKYELAEKIMTLDASDVEIVLAAADALIARREK